MGDLADWVKQNFSDQQAPRTDGGNGASGGGSQNAVALPGEFSVSGSKKARFAKGNLFRTGTDPNSGWRRESNQCDFRTIEGEAAVINGKAGNTAQNDCGLLYWMTTRFLPGQMRH